MVADEELTGRIKQKALDIGYVAVGVTSLDAFEGYAEEIASRSNYDGFVAGGLGDSAQVKDRFPQATCIISLVESCAGIDYPENLAAHVGRVYLAKIYGGVGPGVNSPKQQQFTEYLHGLGIQTFDSQGFMQLPDRAVGARAGVVTYGKNNFAYCGKHGSFVIVTNLLVDAALVVENHPMRRPCPEGCRKCIDACPTHAMNDQGQLDPARCVLYNNMFPTGMLDAGVRPLLGQHIHGCDECQLACPRNAAALAADKTPDERLDEVAATFSLESVLLDGPDAFARGLGRVISPYFKDYERHQRNAAIAMGNSGDTRYLPALRTALETLEDPDAREAVEWAIGMLEN